MILEIPTFADKARLVDWLIQNKSILLAQKKSTMKFADSISFVANYIQDSTQGEVIKSGENVITENATRIKVRSIINTTKYFDSHDDVHIDQLWNKSLKESKDFYLVQEHNFSFGGIVSDNVKAFTKQMTWKELGYNYEGQTQALIFDSVIDKQGSPRVNSDYTMFDLYRMGKVKQHSVGMRYIETALGVNDDRYEKEYGIWNKYFEDIVNKEDVLERGYFWAVTQAKVIEGSGVLRGANKITPTYSTVQIKEEQPGKPTGKQPEKSTVNINEVVKFFQPNKFI